MKSPRQLKTHYQQGDNISALMRADRGLTENNSEIIEVAYDLQAGSYIKALENPQHAERKLAYNEALLTILNDFNDSRHLLEAGVGEATTLAAVAGQLSHAQGYGFDLSWSRVAHGHHWLQRQGVSAQLCTGDLLAIPMASNAIDLVYTSHSIEPNGGREATILQELYRVAGRYLVLFEPGYEFASDEARARMDHHGYCKGLADTARELGMTVVDHRPMPVSVNPLNPTAVTIIEKPPADSGLDLNSDSPFACPQYKTPLVELGQMYYSPEALSVYPVIAGFPCLRRENAIFASSYEMVVSQWGYA
ncbi:class I SAM-dependent methyltransferase [Saccharospirillum sp. HFRX-1]|uniref:class I SAM-dependent methyltransferase n=1 Tax=unclassified Saccharospirillum TaxID=2633430 RepID=UPI003715E618